MSNDYAMEARQKRAFAEQLAQGFSPMVACKRLWGDAIGNGQAYGLGEQWKVDPYVLEQLSELDAEKKKANAPQSKDDFIKEVKTKMAQMEDEAYIKAARLIAEMSNFIDKAAGVTVNTGTVNERVMIIRDHGTDDEWEARAAAQQAKLIEAR